MMLSFVISGDPVGYYAQAARRVWQMAPEQRRRAEKYRAWQEKVQMAYLSARATGAWVAPWLPLTASATRPLIVKTTTYFRRAQHPDPENVHKGVKDALFLRSGGQGDKFTGGWYSHPLYDADNPRVEVELRGLMATSKRGDGWDVESAIARRVMG